MSFEEKIKQNPTLWILGALVTGFSSGFGAFKIIQETGELKTITRAEYEQFNQLKIQKSKCPDNILMCESDLQAKSVALAKRAPNTEITVPPPIVKTYEKIVTSWFCVIKPPGTDDPYGGCDVNRGDKQLPAGTETTILVPVQTGLIPPGAKVDELVKVTGGTYFGSFEKISAKYLNGHIEVTALPNRYGGFNDNLKFVITYSH